MYNSDFDLHIHLHILYISSKGFFPSVSTLGFSPRGFFPPLGVSRHWLNVAPSCICYILPRLFVQLIFNHFPFFCASNM